MSYFFFSFIHSFFFFIKEVKRDEEMFKILPMYSARNNKCQQGVRVNMNNSKSII